MQSWPALKNAASAIARGGGHLDVAEDHRGGLAAQLQVDVLEVVGGRAHHLGPGAGRTGDGHHLHLPVPGQGPAGVPVAADDVDDARRQEAGAQLAEQHGRAGGGVGGFDDERVAGGQRRADLPGGHHQRVVPRRHLGDHSDRLAADEGGVALGVLGRAQALQHPGGPGEVADRVDRAAHVDAAGRTARLAGGAHLGVGERVEVVLHEARELQQQALPSGRGGAAPAGRGGGGRGDRGRDVVGTGAGSPAVDLSGGGVDEVHPLAGGGVAALAGDHVAQHVHGVSFARRAGAGPRPGVAVRFSPGISGVPGVATARLRPGPLKVWIQTICPASSIGKTFQAVRPLTPVCLGPYIRSRTTGGGDSQGRI